jgi:hypothetical protein
VQESVDEERKSPGTEVRGGIVIMKRQKNSNSRTRPLAGSSTPERPPDSATNIVQELRAREVVAMGDEARFQAHLDAQIEVLKRWLDQAEVSNRPMYRKAVEQKQLLEKELRLSRLREGLASPPNLQIPNKQAPEPAVQATPTKDQKPSGSSEKPKRVRRRKKRELTDRDKGILEILKADAEGKLYGSVYCWALEKKKIPPHPEWIVDECPMTYPEAYKLKKWRHRIQDEKYRLGQFLPKKRNRHSSTTS